MEAENRRSFKGKSWRLRWMKEVLFFEPIKITFVFPSLCLAVQFDFCRVGVSLREAIAFNRSKIMVGLLGGRIA